MKNRADWRRDGEVLYELAHGRNSAIAQKLVGFGVDTTKVNQRTLDVAALTERTILSTTRALDRYATGRRAKFVSGGLTNPR